MKDKKAVRKNFRDVCLNRDKDTCRMCGKKSRSRDESLEIFDVHHVTDRSLMPNGGYVLENGITLCKVPCHERAEEFHSKGVAFPGFSPEDLYKKINSSYEKAVEASNKLGS